MARKKKGAALVMQIGHAGPEHMSTDVQKAENGFIVHVSGHTGGSNPSFVSKHYIAHSRPHAARIASHHLASTGIRGAGKRGGKTKISSSKKTLL